MGEDKRMPSYYTIVPASIRYDRELKPSAKLLYGEIIAMSNKEGFCWASNEYLAELLGMEADSVTALTRNLVDRGHIKTIITRHRRDNPTSDRSKVGTLRRIYVVDRDHLSLKRQQEDGESRDIIIKELLEHPVKKPVEHPVKKPGIIVRGLNNKTMSLSKDKDIDAGPCGPVADKDGSLQPKKKRSIYVAYWNSFKGVPTHPHHTTAAYQEADVCICRLMRGSLFTGSDNHNVKAGYFKRAKGGTPRLDRKWMDKNKIPIEWETRAWTDEEVREGLRRISLLYLQEYRFGTDSYAPSTLREALFNDRTGKSMFLKVMANAPKPIADKVAPIDDAVHAMYRKLFKGKALTDAEETKLVRMVNLLVGKQREIAHHMEPYLGHTSFSGKFGSRNNRFFQTHIDWLTGWCEDIRVETVWKTWGAFVRWARDFHKMEIEPSNDNVRHAKQSHRRAEEDRRRREESAERSRLSELAHLV